MSGDMEDAFREAGVDVEENRRDVVEGPSEEGEVMPADAGMPEGPAPGASEAKDRDHLEEAEQAFRDGDEIPPEAVGEITNMMSGLMREAAMDVLPQLYGEKLAQVIHRAGFDEVEFLERLVESVYNNVDRIREEEL